MRHRAATAALAALALTAAGPGCTDYVGDDLRAGELPRQEAVLFDESLPSGEDPPPEPRPVDPRSLEPGDCFEDLAEPPLQAFGRGEEVGAIPCEAPHRYELYARPALADPAVEPWPGDARAEELGDLTCADAFEAFVGSTWSESTLDYLVLAPSEEGWLVGDTRASCALFELGLRPLVGTVEGSGL